MAIILVFNVMLARKAEIDAKYPGGLAQFRNDWLVKPPERWCEDEHLLGFSSMGNYFEQVLTRLLDCGTDVCVTNETVLPEQIISKWDWIECDVGTRDRRADPPGAGAGYMVRYWLKGTEPGETAVFGRRRLN